MITKGKWYTSRHQDNSDVVVRGEDGQIVANCTVDFYGGNPHGEEVQANARLIAAAPDLLVGCKDALEYLRANPDEYSEPRAEKLTMAIKKALDS